jgi:hypothetical protein
LGTCELYDCKCLTNRSYLDKKEKDYNNELEKEVFL